jgi:GTP1/Obg family GTP-binding protein
MKLRHTLLLTAFVISMGFGVTVLAQAPPPQSQPEQIQVSDQQLQQFATAQAGISEVQEEFSAQLQQVEDPDKAQTLREQANEQMIQAVQDAGLDVESFNQIAMAVQNDQALQQRLSAITE